MRAPAVGFRAPIRSSSFERTRRTCGRLLRARDQHSRRSKCRARCAVRDAGLPADYKFTSSDQGAHTFTFGVTLATAGNQTVTATDTITPVVSGVSSAVAVAPGSVTAFQLTGLQSSATAGVAQSFSVSARPKPEEVPVMNQVFGGAFVFIALPTYPNSVLLTCSIWTNDLATALLRDWSWMRTVLS